MKEYKYKINGNTYNCTVGDPDDNNFVTVEVNGTPYQVEMEAKPAPTVKVSARPAAAPRKADGEKVISKPATSAGPGAVKAPLPGVVVTINKKVGDAVKAADAVMMLEAMKIENAINAGRDGVIKSIAVNQGDSVLEGTVLFTIE